jgi:hypothetical protein
VAANAAPAAGAANRVRREIIGGNLS